MPEIKKIWWVVEFVVNALHEETASWLALELGANGCQIIASNNNHITVQSYFEYEKIQPDNLQSFITAFNQYGLPEAVKSLKVTKIEEQDWLAEWKRSIKPLILGDKFIVCPPWLLDTCTGQEYANRNMIILEPGLAFGTGLHATTQFCLYAIEQHLSCRKASPIRILDVGTGSGILSIASAKLFEKSHIDALEISPTACEVAGQNFKLNKVDAQIHLMEGNTDKVLNNHYNYILSNITYEDNVFLLSSYNKLLLQGGKIIFAGILREKLNLLTDILKLNNYQIIDSKLTDEWAGLVVTR